MRNKTDFEHDAELGWYARKNQDGLQQTPVNEFRVRTDGYGHRNDLPYPDDRVLEYVVQGDSNLFGFGLDQEETIVHKLNALLDADLYNVGVSGFDTNHYYFQYKRLAKDFKIKNRIIVFNIGNDFTATTLSSPYFIRRPYLEAVGNKIREVPESTNAIKMPVYGYHFIPKYKEFDREIEYLARGRDWGHLLPGFLSRVPLLTHLMKRYHDGLYLRLKSFSAGEKQKANFLSPYYPPWLMLKREFWPEPYRDFSKDFASIMGLLKQQSENLYIVLIPMRKQVLRDEVQRAANVLAAFGYKREEFDQFAFNKYLMGICANFDIKCIDPTMGFMNHPSPETLFLNGGDRHLSSKGTTFIVERLAEEIVP